MTKKITFHSDNTDLEILKPASSSRYVPEWYRKMNGVTDGVMSVKKCVPFLDSMTSGYIIPLPADVSWNQDSEEFTSFSKIDIVSMHELSQTKDVELSDDYNPTPHKWNSHWFIKTPKGYSTLFVHPLNRLDLPFYCFSGVVDTDKHPVIVNFPFVLKKDFTGTIKAGTPMIQAIPFKRNSWKSKIIDTGESHYYPFIYKVMEPPFGFYKRKFWTRKEYR